MFGLVILKSYWLQEMLLAQMRSYWPLASWIVAISSHATGFTWYIFNVWYSKHSWIPYMKCITHLYVLEPLKQKQHTTIIMALLNVTRFNLCNSFLRHIQASNSSCTTYGNLTPVLSEFYGFFLLLFFFTVFAREIFTNVQSLNNICMDKNGLAIENSYKTKYCKPEWK